MSQEHPLLHRRPTLRRRPLIARRPADCYPHWSRWINRDYASRMVQYVREFESLNHLVPTL